MEIFTICVRFLSYYLVVVATLGSLSKIVVFVASSTNLFNCVSNSNNKSESDSELSLLQAKLSTSIVNDTSSHSLSHLILLLRQSTWIYDVTFPIANSWDSVASDTQNYSYKIGSNEADISMSATLLTLLSSMFLIRGCWQMEYSSCQFWYYIQVGSILLTCIKISIMTVIGLWNAVTNAMILFSIVFSLAQLWLVQTFMENLRRHAESTRQMKCHSQIFAMSDFDLELDACRLFIAKSNCV